MQHLWRPCRSCVHHGISERANCAKRECEGLVFVQTQITMAAWRHSEKWTKFNKRISSWNDTTMTEIMSNNDVVCNNTIQTPKKMSWCTWVMNKSKTVLQRRLCIPMYPCIHIYWCIDVSVYRCIGVSMYRCIGASMYECKRTRHGKKKQEH